MQIFVFQIVHFKIQNLLTFYKIVDFVNACNIFYIDIY